MPAATSRATRLRALHRAHRACHRCVDAGYIAQAHPVFSGAPGQRIMLVGQAPGPVEHDVTRPFAGRAGKQLMRWLRTGGFTDEADVRARVYMTAMTTCFPGRRPDGAGDRRPSGAEVALCSSWLDAALTLVQPRLLLPVGSLALSRFLPGRRLDDVIGFAFAPDGTRIEGEPPPGVEPVVVPLPHPSGQSRWLNDHQRVVRLQRALARLAELVPWALGDEEHSEFAAQAMV